MQTSKDLLSAYRSSLKQLEEQLAFFRRRRVQEEQEYNETFATKEQFFYRSNAQGLIQLQNDASFVAEALFALPSAGSVGLNNTTWRYSLVDASSYRELAHAVTRVPLPGDEPIPLNMLSPSNYQGDVGRDENDYWFYFLNQYLLPRGGVIRAAVSNPPTATSVLLPDFVLGGFKVY